MRAPQCWEEQFSLRFLGCGIANHYSFSDCHSAIDGHRTVPRDSKAICSIRHCFAEKFPSPNSEWQWYRFVLPNWFLAISKTSGSFKGVQWKSQYGANSATVCFVKTADRQDPSRECVTSVKEARSQRGDTVTWHGSTAEALGRFVSHTIERYGTANLRYISS
jgi:hypothetical protein